ncbi:uncharacterized protein LOC129356413 [Poeciliopsis prolifica]|uniref:uncharacterized protein LOC129356413 n=1 Tax=Poeciliopsis prolifica TaxID=188132 RepID=UPI002414604E|nr:uncharacterized protein LOC129356413 [Poeciliopsis prolifica]
MCRYACDIRVVVLMRERSRGNSPPLFSSLCCFSQTQVAAVRVRQDVLSRLPEVRAKITSVFGSVLKMDSTKKVTKKLAGAAANTAGCWTNVSNEHGQVLASVLAAAEGRGLWPMAAGLVRCYREAGAAPPSVMYVDRDRCSPQARGQAQVAAMFSAWTSGALCVGLQQAASRRLTGSTAPSWRRWPVLDATFTEQQGSGKVLLIA